jgi:tRNA dimethylallyltransferase
MPADPRVLFIVGPTAVRKSDIALRIAQKLNGEIISADSMLVYKGMNIGTAKPSKIQQEKVPHHLVDIMNPAKTFSVFDYRKLALEKIRKIIKKKKTPILVGGTGLYVRSLLQGLSELPGANLKLRKNLERRARAEGAAVLYQELFEKNPERAAQIKATDERRIIRALEIHAGTKEKPFKKSKGLKELGFLTVVIGITKDRAELYRDIEMRVNRMFEKGLVKEVRQLSKRNLSQTAMQAVGYKEILAALRGDYSMEKACELIKTGTRHLAKRQWTWFKREEGITWISWEAADTLKTMAEKVLGELKNQGFAK